MLLRSSLFVVHSKFCCTVLGDILRLILRSKNTRYSAMSFSFMEIYSSDILRYRRAVRRNFAIHNAQFSIHNWAARGNSKLFASSSTRHNSKFIIHNWLRVDSSFFPLLSSLFPLLSSLFPLPSSLFTFLYFYRFLIIVFESSSAKRAIFFRLKRLVQCQKS